MRVAGQDPATSALAVETRERLRRHGKGLFGRHRRHRQDIREFWRRPLGQNERVVAQAVHLYSHVSLTGLPADSRTSLSSDSVSPPKSSSNRTRAVFRSRDLKVRTATTVPTDADKVG